VTAARHETGTRFREMHHRDQILLLPNPWDTGTARLLAHLGFEALATTSAGFAHTKGLPDGAVGRTAALDHAAAIAAATPLPVSADLENCFADAPEGVAATVAAATATGIVGCSVEDATGRSDDPIYEIGLAAERVAAAVATAESAGFPFTITARAENFLHGRPDLEDTITRLLAFQEAGAHVVYAPGWTDISDIRAIVAAVDVPVNVLARPTFTVADLQQVGVSRVSVGSGLSRVAYSAFIAGAREFIERGTFGFGGAGLELADLDEIFRESTG